MRQRFCFVCFVWGAFALLVVLLGGWKPVKAQGSVWRGGNSEGECSSVDMVFITSDGAAARAIETLSDILAMHHWAHCPKANYRISVVDAINGSVLLSLTPVTLVDVSGWRDAEGIQINIQGKQRPSFRYQWDRAFKKALEILRNNGDPNRRQILVYAGDVAMDAHVATAEEFVRTELAEILSQYRVPEVWVLSGEEDREFLSVKKAWEDVVRDRGGVLPREDNASLMRPVDYLDAIVQILQQRDRQFYIQKVGCGTYEVPSTTMLAISWLRESGSKLPAVTLEWAEQEFATKEEHNNVWQPVDHRGIIVTDPPVGEVSISASRCGNLIGFAQIGIPSVEVESVARLPQDRGQSFSSGVLRARLVGWRGKSYLGIGKPYPQLTLQVESPDGGKVSLKFLPQEKEGFFVSEPLPRKVVGTYHWRVEGVLPYNGLGGGNGTWVLPSQEGGYQVYRVGVIKAEVTIEDMSSTPQGNTVMLHDSIRHELAVRPVVLRLQVKDEEGHLLLPGDLFEHPEKAFQAVLTNIATGEQDKANLIPKSSFWYGEVGGKLGKTGLYRLEIYKQLPSSEVFVWDSEAPWRIEIRREDPFTHKPVVWIGIAALLMALFLIWLGRAFYVRTAPLKGVLEFLVASEGVVIRRIDLGAFNRRIVTLGRDQVKYSLPEMKVKRRSIDSISIQAGKEVKGLDISLGEEKPLLKGVVVRYIESSGEELEGVKESDLTDASTKIEETEGKAPSANGGEEEA